MNEIIGDPLPYDGQDFTPKAIVSPPLDDITAEQIRGLMRILNFSGMNMLNLKKTLCNGSTHVLASGLSQPQIDVVAPALKELGIKYSVVEAEGEDGRGLADGLNPEIKY